MATTIFYGAGLNAYRNYDKWHNKGLRPVCFVDKSIEKQHTYFDDERKIEIISLEEAIHKYPDYILYMTQQPSALYNIRNYLIGEGIPEERIKCLESVEWRLGCHELNHFIRISGVRMFTCCYLEAQLGELSTPFEKDFETTLKKHTQAVNTVIDKIRNGIPNVCDSCPSLQWGYWEKEPRFNTLALDGWFRDDICNIQCCYCGQLQKNKCNENLSLIEATKELGELLPEIDGWLYTGGEPSAYPHKQELFEYVSDKKWKMLETFTNAVIYDAFFSDKEVSAGVINCSLDSGNRDTYKKIKGLDYFDRVVTNLGKYAADGCKIILKYILLAGINDDTENIEQFFEIAEKIGASVSLSFDQNAVIKVTKDTPLWQAVKQFVQLATSKKIDIKVEYWPLGQEEIQEISTLIDSME